MDGIRDSAETIDTRDTASGIRERVARRIQHLKDEKRIQHL
jgi:hypothetical protein